VLILSEFTGASEELRKALLINPHDIDGLKEAMVRAINMPQTERTSRMRSMRKRVLEHDVARWSTAFLKNLASTRSDRHRRIAPLEMADEVEWTVERKRVR
jgi:trehalose 6-phosphate synthase